MTEMPVLAHAVVVGVDDAGGGPAALDWAIHEAVRRERPLHLVRTAATLPESAPERSDVTLRALNHVRVAVPDLRVGSTDVEGRTPDVLVEASEVADLVVVGTRGRGAARSAIAGSTSVELAAKSHCPVVVIRADEAEPDGGGVVVGIDGSAASRRAVRVAAQEASLRGVPLIAVHAWTMPFQPDGVGGVALVPDVRTIEQEARVVLAESLAGYEEEFPDVDIARRVVEEDPVSALVEAAEDAQLLVVGSRGRGPLRGLVLGSVSQALMHLAPRPLMVVRPT